MSGAVIGAGMLGASIALLAPVDGEAIVADQAYGGADGGGSGRSTTPACHRGALSEGAFTLPGIQVCAFLARRCLPALGLLEQHALPTC